MLPCGEVNTNIWGSILSTPRRAQAVEQPLRLRDTSTDLPPIVSPGLLVFYVCVYLPGCLSVSYAGNHTPHPDHGPKWLLRAGSFFALPLICITHHPCTSIHSSPSACFGSALISSKIPPRCRGEGGAGADLDGDGGGGVILGIDEAGRGPVLGPMTYGAAYWSCADDRDVSAMGFDDSKALTPAQRTGLFDRIDAVRACLPACSFFLGLFESRVKSVQSRGKMSSFVPLLALLPGALCHSLLIVCVRCVLPLPLLCSSPLFRPNRIILPSYVSTNQAINPAHIPAPPLPTTT